MSTRRDTSRQALGLAALGAGVIHLAAGPEHMAHWEPLGVGFYATGAAQVLWGLALLRREALLRSGAVATLLFLGTWLLSRTAGLPVGPEAGVAEPWGRADLLCAALETVVAVGAVILLRRPTAGREPAGTLAPRAVLAATLVAVLASTGVAVAAPEHGHFTIPSDCPTTPVTWGVDKNANGVDDGVERYFACELKRAHEGHLGYGS